MSPCSLINVKPVFQALKFEKIIGRLIKMITLISFIFGWMMI